MWPISTRGNKPENHHASIVQRIDVAAAYRRAITKGLFFGA